MNQEFEFATFERKMLLKYGLRPHELEEVDMYTIRSWELQELREKQIKHKLEIIKKQKMIFEKMKQKSKRGHK